MVRNSQGRMRQHQVIPFSATPNKVTPFSMATLFGALGQAEWSNFLGCKSFGILYYFSKENSEAAVKDWRKC